jgi:EAL and modified HD-GYP domain-containing signal transduction protein
MRDSEILLARQPILDTHQRLFAYELLYRSEQEKAEFLCGNQASSELLLNYLTAVPDDPCKARVPVAVNFPQELLLNSSLLSLLASTLMIEVLEDVDASTEVIARLQSLKNEGFTIALDDFIYCKEKEALLPLADIVKVDIRQFSKPALAEQVALLRRFNVRLLAEKVETPPEFAYCRQLGFELFQGFFFARPTTVTGRKLSSNKQALLHLLAQIQKEDISLAELGDRVAQDACLSYQLLRIINSAAYGLLRPVDSVQQAVVLLGVNQLQCWTTFLLMARVESAPQELIRLLLIRARTCEQVAKKRGSSQAEKYFTVGLFSGVDALLNVNLHSVLTSLPLSEEIQQAILQHSGLWGEVLQQVLLLEAGEWHRMEQHCADLRLLSACYLEAIRWSNDMLETLSK